MKRTPSSKYKREFLKLSLSSCSSKPTISSSDLLQTLSQTRPLFTSYLRIRSLAPSGQGPSPELLSAHHDLISSLRTLNDDLSDLRESIEAIQQDPYKYGLEIEEVSRRRRLVEEVGGEVEDMREEIAKNHGMESNGSASKGKGKEKAKSYEYQNENLARARDYASSDDEGHGTDYNAEFNHQQQLKMMSEQDEVLDDVAVTVGNLRHQAADMGRELEEQNEMLEHVDGLADRVGGRLRGGMKTMGEVVRKGEEKWSGICVWLLVGVLILLLILVLVL